VKSIHFELTLLSCQIKTSGLQRERCQSQINCITMLAWCRSGAKEMNRHIWKPTV